MKTRKTKRFLDRRDEIMLSIAIVLIPFAALGSMVF